MLPQQILKPCLTKVSGLTRFWLVLVGFLTFLFHGLHLIGFSALWFFKCVLKLPAWDDANSHSLHFFGFSPLCVCKCILKELKYKRKQNHIGLICLTFPYCALANVFANWLPERMHNHIGCISFVCSNVRVQMSPQIACLRRGKFTLAAFAWLFSTACFPMFP